MAHPYESHRQGKLEHARVARIAGADGIPKGVRDENALSSLKRGEQSAKVDRITTAKAGSGTTRRLDRFARGGKVRGKGTNVNIIIGAQDKPPMPPLAGVGPAPLPPPVPPGPVMPPAAAGAAGPGPIPMPPHSRGGRAFAKGGAVKKAEGGGVTERMRGNGRYRLNKQMGGDPPSTSFDSKRNPEEARTEMLGQMERSKEISDAVPRRATGGKVMGHERGLSAAKRESMKAGTQVDHRPGKADLGDIRTKPPITYARGGSVPKWLDGGAGSGVGRLEKAEEYGKRR